MSDYVAYKGDVRTGTFYGRDPAGQWHPIAARDVPPDKLQRFLARHEGKPGGFAGLTLPPGTSVSIGGLRAQGPPLPRPPTATTSEKQTRDQVLAARAGLQEVLRVGKGILPQEPGFGAGVQRYVRDYRRWAGYPDIERFKSAVGTALIPHLRAVAGAARVNQREIDSINESISGAATYPALEAAVEEAQKNLNNMEEALRQAGVIYASPTSSTAASPSPAAISPVREEARSAREAGGSTAVQLPPDAYPVGP